MDSPRDGPGQTQRQRRWHQAPSRDAQATSRRLDSPAFAPNAQLPQAPITGTASDHLSLSGHAFSPDSSQWTTGRDGLLPQNTTWLPSSPNEEVMLPSLSETRLLSQLPFGLQTRDSGYVPALPTIAMSSGVVGGASAGAVNQASALHPPYPQSGSMSHSSNSSNASQPSFRFYGSHAWQASNFTNVYQFPERRWRRVYDRGSPNFQPSSRTQSSRPPAATSDRRTPGPIRSANPRPLHVHPRQRNTGATQGTLMNGPTDKKVEPESVPYSFERLAEIRELQAIIKWTLLHPDYQLRKPEPPLDINAMEEKTCDICYHEFGIANPEGLTEDPIRLPGCGHVFGCACLGTWLKSKRNWKCPMCRTPIEPCIDTVYDMDLWHQYLRLRGALTEQEHIEFLQRILASKERPPKKGKGLVLDARAARTRPAPDDDLDYGAPRSRLRLSEPEDFFSDSGLSDDSQTELQAYAQSAAPQVRVSRPPLNNNYAERVRESRDETRNALSSTNEPSDAPTERALSDIEFVGTPPVSNASRVPEFTTFGRYQELMVDGAQLHDWPHSGITVSANQ